MTNREHPIDPAFVDKLQAICDAKLSPEARANIAELDAQRLDIRAAVMLLRAIRSLEKNGKHLSDEVRNQILVEHIHHLNTASKFVLVAQIADQIELAIRDITPSGDFAAFIIKFLAFADAVAKSAKLAQHNSAVTVLQNITDLFPEAVDELNKEK